MALTSVLGLDLLGLVALYFRLQALGYDACTWDRLELVRGPFSRGR
jgi:hypothetical protein